MIERLRQANRGTEKAADEEVVEISLLLSGRQVSALESAAHDRGLTAAEMVRHVLRDFLAQRRREVEVC
jgi:hypothetical protein